MSYSSLRQVCITLLVLAAAASAMPAAAQTDFYTLPLCRVYDSRPGAALDQGTIYDVTVAGACGVPADAVAVVLNVTLVGANGDGTLAVFPTGTTPPFVDMLAFRNGRTQAVFQMVALGTDGKLSFQATFTPPLPPSPHYHIIIDVSGYYVYGPPVAVDDTYAAEKDTTLNVNAAAGVTSNDTLNGGSILSYGASTGSEQTTIGAATPTSAGGSIALNANGSFVYNPPPGAVGIDDTFKYILQSPRGTSTGTVTIGVGKASQTISFTSTAPAGATVGGATYTVTATATSGLPVTFTIDATATSVCSIAGSTVSFIGVGTCVINANQAGDVNYNPALQVQQSFAVGKGDQTITFTSIAPADAKVGGPTYTVTATASSGLTVAFTIDASAASVCSIVGSTVSFLSVGTCVINADQAGDANYNPAPQVQQSFAVGKGSQTITFTSTAPGGATVNGPTYNVTATATSGLPVTFTIDASATSVCSIAGSTVSFLAAGTCVINANQAGDANYDPAPQVQQSFAVSLASQTISFTSTAPVDAKVGGPTYTVTATATSGLTVTFTIDATASTVCTIAGSTVSFIGTGTCVINANQPGDASYAAAPQEQQSFPVAQGDQTISFTSTAPVNAKVGGPTYNVTATATSGLTVTFAIDASASSVCSIVGSTVSFIGAGTCVINANQAGDANWNAAPQAQQSFPVAQGDQTISFTSTAPVNAKVGGPTYSVTATATSGLPVTFTIDASAASVCTIAGSTVSFIGAGTCVINANQAGNANYNAAPQVQQSFSVAKGDQTISFTSTPPAGATAGGPTYTVTATATSGLTVAFTIDASAASVCTIAGSTVSFIGGGTCVINANQPGDANWNPAPQVQQSFAVVKQNQTITFTSSAPVGATVAGPTYTVTATATSGLPVTFTIDASAASVCTVAGSTVSFIGAGTCVINANQAGNAIYNAAPQVQQSFLVVKQNQTIAFTSTPPTQATIGGPTYTVTATATSGLPVAFTIDALAASVCTVAGSTVSFIGGGTCVINANQAGNGTYNPAPQVQQSFHVNFPPQFTTNPVIYVTPGNTQLHVAGATRSGVASWSDAVGLLAKSGASDPDSGPGSLSVVPSSGTTVNGGSYSIIDTSFTYVPAAGFTGTDSFTFQVTDTLSISTGTVNITVGPRVWYIRDVVDANNPASGDDGRSTNPFDSIAEFNAATTNNGDIIFVFEGNTGTTPHVGSITLKDGQKLWGQGIALDVPGFGTPLVTAANKARIRTTTASTDVVSVPATGGSRSNVEVRGLDLEATGATSNAIDVTASGGNTVGITISNNNVRGATSEGIDLNSGATAAFSATVQNNTITSVGNGIDTRVSSTGTATVTASSNMITSTAGNAVDMRTLAGASALRVAVDSSNVAAAGSGIVIDGSAAGTTTITSFANNTVDGNTVGTGISVTSATFDGTPGGTFQTILAGTTSVGSVGNGVGGLGMTLANVAGDLSFSNLLIVTGDAGVGGGAGLQASGTTPYTGSAGFQITLANNAATKTITANSGPALNLSTVSANLPSQTPVATQMTVTSTNSSTTGVALNSVTGVFSAGSGSSISGSSGTGFQVGLSNATVTYGGTINTTAGKGVDLTSNTGSTISFTGTLSLSSGGTTAFNATGGGTVTATDTASTLTTSTGTALNVANTTIGSGGLKFRSISAGTAGTGPTNGIVLNNTGSSGGLTVSGTGSAGSGGTIRKAGTGISLTNTRDVSLSWMQMNDFTDFAIRGNDVTNFTLNRSVVSGTNGDSVPSREGSVIFNNLFGTATVSHSTISGGVEDNLRVENTSGTLTSFTLSGTGGTGSSCQILNNSTATGNIGFRFAAFNSANMTASVSNCLFRGNRTDSINIDAANTSTVTSTITNNYILAGTGGNNQGNLGINVTSGATGLHTTTVSGNFVGTDGVTPASLLNTGINLFSGNGSTLVATVTSNTVRNAGTGSGHGIQVFQDLTSNLRVNVDSNTVSNVALDFGIRVEAAGDPAAVTPAGSLHAGVTNNNVSVLSTALDAIRVRSRRTTTLCVDVRSNTTNAGGSGFFGLFTNQANTSTFNVEGLALGAQTAATTQTYLIGQNPAAATVSATAVTNYNGVAANSCSIP